MTSSDTGSGRDPIDPDFADLFRPADLSAPADAGPANDAPRVEPPEEPVLAASAPPGEDESASGSDDAGRDAAEEVARSAAPGPAVDTGRLFRSRGVAGHQEAVLALSSDHFGRLRTLERVDEEPAVLADAGPAVVTGLAAADPVSIAPDSQPPGEEATMTRRERRRRAAEQPTSSHRSRSISAGAAYLIVCGVTVLVGFANAFLTDGDIGWPTGIALVASSVYAALTVRRDDDAVAIIVPPIAFLLVALTAAQLFLGSTEGSLVNRAVVVFFTLADNWYWIIGATAAALAIVLVRRRRV